MPKNSNIRLPVVIFSPLNEILDMPAEKKTVTAQDVHLDQAYKIYTACTVQFVQCI